MASAQYNPRVTRRLLALFAKAPVAGQVKTRLVPPLAGEDAARLYEAMLLDVVDLHAAWGGALALWYTPAAALEWFRRRVPAAYRLLPQEGPDLGRRMAHLFRVHAAEGHDAIVLRGTDSPTLPACRVDAAFAALEAADLVVCPDRDGGYNLIGLRAPHDELFDLAMSTASVLEQTLERARVLGLRLDVLPRHYDVDTAEDLALLRADPAALACRRTARWLAAHPRAGR